MNTPGGSKTALGYCKSLIAHLLFHPCIRRSQNDPLKPKVGSSSFSAHRPQQPLISPGAEVKDPTVAAPISSPLSFCQPLSSATLPLLFLNAPGKLLPPGLCICCYHPSHAPTPRYMLDPPIPTPSPHF